MSKKEFDIEEAARLACEQFDREHNEEDMSQGETEKLIEDKKNKLGNAEMSAKIENVPGTDELGVVCQLPETKEQAYMLLLGMIKTIGLAGGDSFENIIAEMTRMNSMNVMENGVQIERPEGS